MKKLLYFVLLTFVLCGCSKAAIDVESSLLMPRPVALKIFAKHGAEDWIENPSLEHVSPLCGTERVQVKTEQLNIAQFNKPYGSLALGEVNRGRSFMCPTLVKNFKGLSQEEAIELTHAAVALGANIEKVTIFNLP